MPIGFLLLSLFRCTGPDSQKHCPTLCSSMETTVGSVFKIDKLNDSNVHVRKQIVKLVFSFHELENHILQSVTIPKERSTREQFMIADEKVNAIIGLSLGDEHLKHVRDCQRHLKCQKLFQTYNREVHYLQHSSSVLYCSNERLGKSANICFPCILARIKSQSYVCSNDWSRGDNDRLLWTSNKGRTPHCCN